MIKTPFTKKEPLSGEVPGAHGPLLYTLYHGTNKRFSRFDSDKIGNNFVKGDRRGFFFSSHKPEAAMFAAYSSIRNGGEAHIISARVLLDNPYIVAVPDYAEEGGYGDPSSFYDMYMQEILSGADRGNHDGIIVRNERRGYETVIAFHPEQIETFMEEAEFKQWFGDSKIVNEQGRPLVLYHGTPDASFEDFKEDQFFSADPAYAAKYTSSSSASSSFYGIEDKDTAVIAVYVRMEKPFDTRNSECKEIYEKLFFNKFGNGVPLTGKNLPDWVEARDLIEFLKEEIPEYGFDGVLIDEGADAAGQRPMAYVPFYPEQIVRVSEVHVKEDRQNKNIRTLYHGTSSDFTEFKVLGHGEYGRGIYLSDRQASAAKWGAIAGGRGGKIKVLTVQAEINKPYITTKLELHELALEEDEEGEPIGMAEVHRRLKADGYDAIIGTGLTESDVQYIVFEPTQLTLVKEDHPGLDEGPDLGPKGP